MSRSSRKKIDRPFPPAILERARRIAADYQIILQTEDGEYYGRGLELPFVMSDGKTPDECVRATREALAVAIATALEAGKSPPSPASRRQRTEQINIRVSPEEKLLLEEAARSSGFRGISDYVRTASLSHKTEDSPPLPRPRRWAGAPTHKSPDR
ncbi:MAG TPA: type II toxin-antitoxin system HicB family antitoxin [Tepidisphaeraceae bacterium]|nr:type II toxin-antitoxin system HicB family antitoxin [Tepidisphaeraceae bacterium]